MILKFVKSVLRPIKPIIIIIPYCCFITLLGFVSFHFFPRKSFVFILSPMRSGSTLLKALLAEANDVSNLPEIGFYRYNLNKYYFYYQMYKLSPKKIIVLKKPYPGTYKISNSYVPNFSGVNIKLIVLIRSPGDCMNSYQKHSSVLEFDAYKDPFDYWCSTYENIFSSDKLSQNDARLIYYEDLVNYPCEITEQLFSFIGSRRSSGTDTYSKPSNYAWKWGSDSGAETIKALKVIKPDTYSKGASLNQFAETSSRVFKIKEILDSYESIAIRPNIISKEN